VIDIYHTADIELLQIGVCAWIVINETALYRLNKPYNIGLMQSTDFLPFVDAFFDRSAKKAPTKKKRAMLPHARSAFA